jgi:RNA polymerase sigma-70 factor (ECF subfamily)
MNFLEVPSAAIRASSSRPWPDAPAVILRDIAHPELADNPFSGDYIQRLVNGDKVVEDHFNQWFRSLLVVKVRRNYRAREIVDDVVQETFLRVLRNLRRDPGLLDQPEKLGAYVCAVCNNVILELTRSENRYVGMEGTEDLKPDSAADAIESLCDEERRQQVFEIVNALSPRDKALLRLVFLEERSKDEVCREMNVDRDYLRVVLHRAIQRCKSLLRRTRNPEIRS